MAETKNNITTVVNSLVENAQGLLTSKTVIGEPIYVGDTIISPLTDLTIGIGAGANNTANGLKKDNGMGGLSARVSPSAVLVIRDGYTKVVNIKNQDTLGKFVDMIPEILDKIKNRKTRVSDEQAADIAFPDGKLQPEAETVDAPEAE